MAGIMIARVRAYAWLKKMKIAQKKLSRRSKAEAKIFNQSHKEDMSEDARKSQIHQASALKLKENRDRGAKELTMKELNSRAVKFSISQTCVIYFDAETEISRHSLLWYKSADLKQFKEDRIIDASKIQNEERTGNDEKICWWGLERLIVPSVGSKTKRVREEVKQVVLCKQGNAHLDRHLKKASEWAAKAAQEKATYYSSHL